MDAQRRTDGVAPYGDLRQQVDDACGRVGPSREALELARANMSEARRALANLNRTFEDARRAVEPARIKEAKRQAQAAYRRQIAASDDVLVERRATLDWMTAIDRINRDARRAGQQLARAEHDVQRLTAEVTRTETLADAARIALESALAACSDAREALATADGGGESALLRESTDHGWMPGAPELTSSSPSSADGQRLSPAAATGAPRESEAAGHRPVMVERMAEGDRDAFAAVAAEVSHLAGQPASHYILLLHELVEALTKVATDRYCLAFEEGHPLWAQFDPSERLAIVRSLGDLGFRIDPDEGWYGGRTPTANDLVMALAYAGRDPRMLRGLPTPDELRSLPNSVRVVTLDLLTQFAPDLTLSQMLEVLGPRAEGFGELWDDWGRIRPVLLSEADALAA